MTHKAVEQLVRAAGSGAAELDAVTAAMRPEQVASILIDEVLFRAGIPDNDWPVVIEVRIMTKGLTIPYFIRAAKGVPVDLIPQPSPDKRVAMRIDYDVAELARELFGSRDNLESAARATTPLPRATKAGPGSSTSPEQLAYLGAAAQAVHAVLEGCTSKAPDLAKLAVRHRSAKNGLVHRFGPRYERHLRPLRRESLRVLEIGFGGYDSAFDGGSLRMWKHYFPRSWIFGLDISDQSHLDEQRITTLRADQSDTDALVRIAGQYGPFDVVIDDGSHINEHVRSSFAALLPYVRTGGYYVIEDLWTSYRPSYGGSEDPADCGGTSLGLLKTLTDGLHHEELPVAGIGGYAAANVTGLHVYHNIAFIEKGRNTEGGVPRCPTV
ncbi:class I SAM-dependent methyltransferase [Kibdelosporangium persicum]|uniref:Class I SAM-dependent methyltransferase n=1 Tax=Kibdelosporangium persicum TaxID=2698649 RepID=A0ABX2F0Q1_9PSEU|nr:class I SAM-dependent methyltransferase [Kibdelosporangium persicum]NRN64709.1 Class I SAM-dependent methyltransferase [Kibdelosporangium persicum]